MKLTRITKSLRSVQLRVSLSGELNAALESYTRYYQHAHIDAIEPRALIPEILRAFIDRDREFQAWSRSRQREPDGTPTAPPSGSATKASARLTRMRYRLTRRARVEFMTPETVLARLRSR